MILCSLCYKAVPAYLTQMFSFSKTSIWPVLCSPTFTPASLSAQNLFSFFLQSHVEKDGQGRLVPPLTHAQVMV